MRVWVINPSIHLERGEAYSFRTIRCIIGGGLFRIVTKWFIQPDHTGFQICLGIFRCHVDFDLFFISRPEEEIRNDKSTNRFEYSDDSIEFHSWFLGYEGVGVYRKSSLVDNNRVSHVEFGAHPLFCLGLTNVINPLTQHAIIGFQFANLQLGIHSAIDSKSGVA